MYTHTHTDTHTYVYTHVQMYTFTPPNTCMYTHIYIYICIQTCTNVYNYPSCRGRDVVAGPVDAQRLAIESDAIQLHRIVGILIYTYTYIHTYIHIYLSIYLSICLACLSLVGKRAPRLFLTTSERGQDKRFFLQKCRSIP